jgi:hypothetical protein
MGVINTVDFAIKKALYLIFWRFIDPLESDRLYSQLVDVLERNLDASDPEKLVAPDHFQVFVNNAIFIKHAHSINKLATLVRDRMQKYVANKDYELQQPKIALEITSSATVSKKNADIRCWFSSEDAEGESKVRQKPLTLKVISGKGTGNSWDLQLGKTYVIGRFPTCDICLPFKNISKTQAAFSILADGKIKLTDEGSTNGTFINDERAPVKGSRIILQTDKIQLCKAEPIVLVFLNQ